MSRRSSNMGGGSVYGGDEEEIDVYQVRNAFVSLANLAQSGIVDIDDIQNHGRTRHLPVFHVAVNLGRCQCLRHHEAEAEWHPHRWRTRLPTFKGIFMTNFTSADSHLLHYKKASSYQRLLRNQGRENQRSCQEACRTFPTPDSKFDLLLTFCSHQPVGSSLPLNLARSARSASESRLVASSSTAS